MASKKIALAGLLALGALASGQGSAPPSGAEAWLFKPTGERVGTVTMRAAANGVSVTVDVRGLPPGPHGFHLHREGDCAPGPDDTGAIVTFGKAGPHFDPNKTMNHDDPGAPSTAAHAGDFPMLVANAEGRASATFTTTKFTLAQAIGRGVIVHANPDDYETDPGGKSGARLVCGEVVAANARARNYQLFDSNAFPEGITFDAKRGLMYVTSTTTGDVYHVNASTGEVKVHSRGGSPGRQSAVGIKLDAKDRLWIAGGATGRVNVIRAADGSPVASFVTPESPQAFINDLALAPDGSVYVTDSGRPALYRVTPDMNLERWLDLTRTPIRYRDGVNLNGIVVTADGRYLIAVQTNTGQLWRFDTRTKAVREVRITNGGLQAGDGLHLDGTVLHVVRNTENAVTKVSLSRDFTTARIVSTLRGASFKFPTTMTMVGADLAVVNGQLDKQRGAVPDLPFTVTRLPKF